MRKSPFLRC